MGSNTGVLDIRNYEKRDFDCQKYTDCSYNAFELYANLWHDFDILDCLIAEEDGTYSVDFEKYSNLK